MCADAVGLATLSAEVPELAPRIIGDGVAIIDLSHDSRSVVPNGGFIAIRGSRTDGHDHVGAAIEKGATAVVVDHPLDIGVPQLVVADTRRAMARLAAAVHRHPADAMTVVGVTGTNGKTTVTFMLESIAAAAGRSFGLVGTIGAKINGLPVPVARTTPESSDLQRLLAAMRDQDVVLAALEVSSHALEYGRADAIRFDVVGFTNLQQDHLDFHGDMESYYAAKRSLFTSERAARAVIWIDDPAGARLASETDIDVVTVGFGQADVVGRVEHMSAAGSRIVATSPSGAAELVVPLPGRFNAANGLIAMACALEVGIELDAIVAGMRSLSPIRGRFETVDHGQPFTAVVDYAHTPDAIEAVIAEARAVAPGRVLAVFGAAGDRDRGKRPLMGAAGATADVAILTSDNPRSEDPLEIIAEVRAGVPAGRRVEVEADRATAIRTAVGIAEPGDIVLVLGKGHEQGQEFATETLPFDDRTALLAALRLLESGAAP